MTERLSDITARIDGIRQLGTVVNAIRGIAAARAQQARGQLVAVDSYAATIAAAVGRALILDPAGRSDAATGPQGRPALSGSMMSSILRRSWVIFPVSVAE